MSKLRQISSAVLAASLVPVAAQAEDGGANRTVVTPNRREAPAFESASATHVVGQEEIEFEMPNDVPDMMLALPGVMVQRTNRGAATPILRGLTGPENLLLLDGVRLNMSTYRTGPNQYAALVDPFALQAVEVVLGPGSVLYGTDAMGGTINHLTRGLPTGPGKVEVSMTGASIDTGFGARVHGELTAGALAGWVRGGVRILGELTAGEGTEVPLSGYNQYDWGTKLRLKLGDDWALTGTLIGSFTEDAGRIDNLGRGEVRFADNLDNLAYLRLSKRAEGMLRRLVFTTSFHAINEVEDRRRCNTVDGGGVEDRSGCISGSESAVKSLETKEDGVNGLGISAELGLALMDQLDLDLGAEFRNEWVSSARVDDPTKRGNFSDGSTFGTVDGWLWLEGRPLWSDYIENDQKVRVKVEGGLRATAVFAHAPDVPGVGDVDYDFAGLVGAVRASALIGQGLHFWGGFSQGFRAPNLQETTVLGDTGSTFEIPNPDLGPQKNDTVELGLKMRTEQASFALVGFTSTMTDSIAREKATFEGQEQVDGKDVYRRINAGKTEYTGIEAQLEVGPFKGVTVLGSVGYVDGTTESGDDEVTPRRLPPFQGRAAIRYQSGWKGLRVESGVRFSAAQNRLHPEDERDYRICGNSDGTALMTECEGTPGWANVYIGAAIQPVEDLEVRLRAENMLDQEYKVHGSGFLSAGRSFELGLGYRFQ